MWLWLLLSACSQDSWCQRFNLACDLSADPTLPEVVDEDGDVWAADVDCDDHNADVHPSAEEICDGLDNDCDLEVDEGTPGLQIWYYDEDLDGYGLSSNIIESCEQPPGYSSMDGDCDDLSDRVNPGVLEICGNSRDDNCDGLGNQCLLEGDLGVDEATLTLVDSMPSSLGVAVAELRPDSNGQAVFVGDPGGNASEGLIRRLDAEDLFGQSGDASLGSYATTWDLLTPGPGTAFGTSIAASLGPDGRAYVAAGAPGASQDQAQEGAIVFYNGVNHSYLESNLMRITGGAAMRRLGQALINVGDANGDAIDDLLMGAPGDQGGGGSAALLLMPLSSVIELGDTALWFRDAPAGAALGARLTGGDLDGDGLAELVMPTPDEDGGRVRVAFAPHAWGQLPVDELAVAVVGEQDGDRLGASAVVADDIDGDGRADLVLGAPGTNDQTGSVYVLLGGQDVWDRAGRIDPSTAAIRIDGTRSGDLSGTSLATGRGLYANDEPDVVIGSPGMLDQDELNAVGRISLLEGPDQGTTSIVDATGSILGTPRTPVGDDGSLHLISQSTDSIPTHPAGLIVSSPHNIGAELFFFYLLGD